MRFTRVLAALTGAAVASAQISLPSTIFGLPFGAQCQQTVIGLLTNSSFGTCFHAADLLPILTTNGSIIPILDNFMSDTCYTSGCTNDTLNAAAATIIQGCASDLMTGGVSNATIGTIFQAYPLIREVLCLKTTDPYTNASYGGFLGNPPIPISAAYNQTNGTFCVTSVLTQLSAYFGANLTYPYIAGALGGQNTTAAQLATSINPNILCNNCLFGALDVVETVIPAVGSVPVAAIVGLLNISFPDNTTTVNTLFNATCAYKPLAVTPGMLPANISVSIVNSTLPLPF